jgi:acetyl esterase/lipase
MCGYLAACSACPGLDAAGEDMSISSKPNATVLFFPFLPFINEQSKWKIVPTLHLVKDTPPTLILFGTKDELLKRGEEFMTRSKEVGHRAEMFLADGVGHGFFNAPIWRDRTLYRVDEFLATLGYLEGKPTVENKRP